MKPILTHPIMEEDRGMLGGNGSSSPASAEIEMERNIYHKVQEFFASIDGGFCEQTDNSDVTDGSFYQVLEFITTNDIFLVFKESQFKDSPLVLSIRYDNEKKVIEDICFEASFFNRELEDDSIEFSRRYSIMMPMSEFITDTDSTLSDHYDDFDTLVSKFKESIVYS